MPIIDALRLAGKNHRKYTGEFGIEIETETKKVYDQPIFTYWTAKGDGSLRDYGVEFVLKQPVKYYQEVTAALEEFHDKTKGIPFIKDSISTSVHVHVNMLNETFKTMGNFLTLYCLFENLLIRYSGPDRLSNLFCLPICDAEETYRNMVSMFRSVEAKNMKGLLWNEAAVKYAACNLATLGIFGSIELRSFRGETDVEKIKNWVSIIYRLLDFARSEINPKEIIGLWKERQIKLLDDVFTDYRKELTHPDELVLIEQNLWYAASVAYSVKDWNELDIAQPVPEFKPKQKEMESASIAIFGRSWNEISVADQRHVLHYLEKTHYKKYVPVEINPFDNMRAVRMGQDQQVDAPPVVIPNPPRPRARRVQPQPQPVAQQLNPVGEIEIELDRPIGGIAEWRDAIQRDEAERAERRAERAERAAGLDPFRDAVQRIRQNLNVNNIPPERDV